MEMCVGKNVAIFSCLIKYIMAACYVLNIVGE